MSIPSPGKRDGLFLNVTFLPKRTDGVPECQSTQESSPLDRVPSRMGDDRPTGAAPGDSLAERGAHNSKRHARRSSWIRATKIRSIFSRFKKWFAGIEKGALLPGNKIHGGAPSEAELKQYFRVSPPAVHPMILTLEARGLIERTPRQPGLSIY